jgi:ubiquitin carboxyl-terminal hydrolase 34
VGVKLAQVGRLPARVMQRTNFPSRFFTEFLDRSREGYPALNGFICQFSRLAGRFVAMDVRMLSTQIKKHGDDGYPDLPSRGYLLAFSYLLRKDEPGHIGKNLETHYNWAWDEEIPLWLANFQNGGGSLSNLAKLAEEQVKLVPQLPKIVEGLGEPCRLITRILNEATNPAGEGAQHLRQPAEPSRQHLTRAYDFFKVMSAGLVSIIEDHVASLSPDSAQTIVNSLTSTLYNTLLYENGATRDLIAAKREKHPEIPARYVSKAISFEWKFTILRMLIKSTQMQLRVVGVTTMCTDLLALHNVHKGNDVSQNSLLLYFADFVIRNKIMEYLVGIASHPEIINESYNILGFLIVTNTYDTSLVSTIWQTVTTSQDPRVVEAILRMLQRCFHLQRYDDLVYLCKKASSFPVDSFTVAMREFCDELLRILMDKAAFEGVQQIDAPPYLMCTWLLRESSRAGAEPPTSYLDIQNFAAARLRDLVGRGPSDIIRDEIYLGCVLDVSSKSATAPGSICVINGLLRERLEPDLQKLTTEHGLTSLVIQELGCTVAEDRLTFNQSVRNSPVSVARRELLLNIILKEPTTLTTELGTKLWNLLVGCESKSVIDRNTSWAILNNAVKRSSMNNVFIATCFETHLPTLPPDCFTLGALEFARAALSAWLEEIRNDFVREDLEFESPALDQLWRMILIALPNSIDVQAIHTLVEVYLDSGLILSLPRAKARSIHLALVDRCLGQLASAAAKLKSFDPQSNSSGEDAGMVEVASEAEFQEQEVIFARSLAVLREFLRAYQSKPQFATPKSRATLSGLPNTVEGEPITVKYQSFDGGKHTEVMTLTLGKLNTAASLFSSLQKATGFKSFMLYYGGKGFDPDEIEVSRSLEDLNLNGLVLVQKRSEEDVPGLLAGTKTSLELEITKHMDELWGYLGMHDKVAQEVRSRPISYPFPISNNFLDLFVPH